LKIGIEDNTKNIKQLKKEKNIFKTFPVILKTKKTFTFSFTKIMK
jgi:hypothetical protein